MLLPLAYSFSYGSCPTPDQVQVRFWFFIFLVSCPALVVYGVSKIAGDEFKVSVFSWIFWLSILVAMMGPAMGPAHAVEPMLVVLLLCGSAELLRQGRWEKIKGVAGLLMGGLALGEVTRSAFTPYMMTGRIL